MAEQEKAVEAGQPGPNSYVITTLEIEKAINYTDLEGHERWLVMRLRARKGRDASVPFVSTALERLIDEHIESAVKQIAGQKPKTLGEHLNSLEWFRSKKRPELELTSKDCETFRLLMENIRKTGTFEYEGFSYFIMKDEKTVGRTPIQ